MAQALVGNAPRQRNVVSVVMPVYNIYHQRRRFLSAVRSIKKQSHQEWELIIVNDGSTDNTPQILSQLKDSRIRIVNKQNEGVESARREGIRQAQGTYLIHIDQDDLYEPNAIEIFLKEAVQSNADVVMAHHDRFLLNHRLLSFGGAHPNALKTHRIITHEIFMNEFYISFFGINDFPVNIWNKLYKISFLKRCPTPPLTGQIIEDLSYNMYILPYANRISLLPNCLYHYRWGGLTNHFDPSIKETALTGYRHKRRLIDTYNLQSFKRTTAIELLNYLNSYFYNSILYLNTPYDVFVTEARNTLALPEVAESMSIMKQFDDYHNPHIDCMLKHDYRGLYEINKVYIRQNYWRERIKKLCLSV